MELFRALAAAVEPPSAETARIGTLLDLGPPPEEAAWSDLFLFQLYPFASVYLGNEGQIGGEARDRIAGFWRALKLAPPAEPDHLATLLAFYAEICRHESKAADATKASTTSSPGAADAGSRAGWRHARKALLWEHLLSWLPLYLVKLESIDDGFYARWAALVRRSLSHEAAELGVPDEAPLHLREAEGLADPRREGASAFLDSLLAPARAGFVIVRSDLARAAADTGLSLRQGERRFVLEALLGQDAKRILDWLSRAADRSVAHYRKIETDSVVSRFWTERADAASTLLAELANNAPPIG